MTFLNPVAFYLLGTIPIVFALHFLKLRRQRYVVPSILLWRTSIEDQKANVPFQRLLNVLLPILQCLFLLLIITSVARPALRIPSIIHGKIIYIIDNSASMQSTEMGETRLSLAKKEVLKQIKQVSASGGIMIMVTHPAVQQVHQTFTTDKQKLQAAIVNIQTTHIGAISTSVFDLASQYVDTPQDQIIFVSDSFENIPTTSVSVKTIPIGSTAENIGVVQFTVERIADQYTVLARIQNWTETEREVDTRLELEGNRPISEKTVRIPAGEVQSVLYSIGTEGLENISISLNLVDVDDEFALDNRAWAILKPKQQFRILLVSDRSQPLLTRLLKSAGDNVELQTVSTAEFQSTVDVDVVIFDGSLPKSKDFLNNIGKEILILINPKSELPILTETTFDVITTPVSVIKEDRTHPIMQDISLLGLRIKESVKREIPTWGHSIIETEKGPLIWLGTEGDRQFLVFEFDAFNPEISTFPITIPDVALFMYQYLEWLESRTAPIQSLSLQQADFGMSYRSGENLKIELPNPETGNIQVKKPVGTTINLENDVFTETDQVGVYSVYVDDSLYQRFAVNLLNESESALSTINAEINVHEPEDSKNTLKPLMHEIWQWVALFAVGFLLCEWWCYHRN